MSLADYLAKKYLTADAQPEKKKSKKRKRKEAEAAGLIIADDDATGWNSGPQTNEDDEAPMSGTTSRPLHMHAISYCSKLTSFPSRRQQRRIPQKEDLRLENRRQQRALKRRPSRRRRHHRLRRRRKPRRRCRNRRSAHHRRRQQ